MISLCYAAAASVDDESFVHCCAGSWWEAALEWADENEDTIAERAIDRAADRMSKSWCDDIEPTAADRAGVTVAVGVERKPESVASMILRCGGPEILWDWMESHDDYAIDAAGNWTCGTAYGATPSPSSREATAELARLVDEWMTRHDLHPKWFIVEVAQDIPIGFAEECARVAAQIDLRGPMSFARHPRDGSAWIEATRGELYNCHGLDRPRLSLWNAAGRLGIDAPACPMGFREPR
jgi:hypothetical protein